MFGLNDLYCMDGETRRTRGSIIKKLREKLTSDAEMGKQMDKKEQKQDSTAGENVTTACLTLCEVPDLPSPPPLKRHMCVRGVLCASGRPLTS